MKSKIFIWLAIICFSLPLSAQEKNLDAFLNQTDYFLSTYVNEGMVDYEGLKNDLSWTDLIANIGNRSLDQLDQASQKAFYINAYNVLIIDQVNQNYPISSVNEVANFFTQKTVVVNGQKISLDGLEKMILKQFDDPRLHLVLVCGAVSCPKLINKAYRPAGLEQQIEAVTKSAFSDPRIFSKLGNEVFVSKIFSWYENDFGNLKEYFNGYLPEALGTEKISFLVYDWSLNDQKAGQQLSGNNSNRYVSSATVPKGGWELKLFNNFYSQTFDNDQDASMNSRNTFYTSSLSALYGLTSNLNVGLSTRYRRVNTELGSSNFLHVFNSSETGQFRTGITAVGPQLRWAPSRSFKGFSIQSAFLFPVGEALEASPYIDWNGASWFNQFFYDQSLGEKFSLFTELGFTLEDIGTEESDINRITLPATVILSYFPVKNLTVYGLANYANFVQGQDGGFWQLGPGVKYQFTPKFELELLHTYFGSTDLTNNKGDAATYNLGLRFNL